MHQHSRITPLSYLSHKRYLLGIAVDCGLGQGRGIFGARVKPGLSQRCVQHGGVNFGTPCYRLVVQ
ncbi:MAG: hypothetical protein V4627_01540 [Pseudomonadota bacterium]